MRAPHKRFFTDERGVSPAVGIVILIGIAVVLAAVIGAFVFGVSSMVNDPAPDTDIEFVYTSETNNLKLQHNGGTMISPSNSGRLKLKLSGTVNGTINGDEWNDGALSSVDSEPDVAKVTGEINAGDTIWDSTQGTAAGNVTSGDTIELVWVSEDGDSTFVLDRETV